MSGRRHLHRHPLVQTDLLGYHNGAPEDPEWRNTYENQRRNQRNSYDVLGKP